MAHVKDSDIEILAYSFRTLSRATTIGETVLRQAAKDGRLETKKIGARHVILRKAARKFLDQLPTGHEHGQREN